MRTKDQTSSVRNKLFDSRKSRLNTGVIRDFEGIIGGNIKIGTHQDFLTGDVDITNGEFTHS
jgi:hypothetical protein